MLWPPSMPAIDAIRPLADGALDVRDGTGQGQVGRVPGEEPVEAVELLERRGDGLVPGQVGRHVDGPELSADAAGTQPRQVGVQRWAGDGDVDPVQVVGRLEPQLPEQVVVPVDERRRPQQVDQVVVIEGGRTRGHTGRLSVATESQRTTRWDSWIQ